MTCEQFNDFVEIYLVPDSVLSLATPFQVYAPTIAFSEFSMTEEQLHNNVCFALSIPAVFGKPSFEAEIDETVETKVQTEKTRAGFQKKVSVSFSVSDFSADVEEVLLKLEKNPHHLLMYKSDGTRMFVRTDSFSYNCSIDDSSEVKNIDIEITNINGIQQVI